ncbi:hypothetical protein [Caldicellulosiruptor saccharolyticus]|uniref:hypothetical protein n=1 Tax=Caldicellulosiruptor saccharolyticus TaxID=44001 RepID=UPI001E34B11A|nr:hypothetical protein [Caldicellulosiruptor saccharolyticus]
MFKRDKSTESSFNQNTTQVVYKTEYDESLLKNNIPEQKIEKFIEVNKKKIEKSSDSKIIRIEYPYIVKHTFSQIVVEKVNNTIENFVKRELDEIEKDKSFTILGISYDYHFLKSKNIFSVIFFIDGGGTGGYYESKTFNFDLDNGKLIPREDIIDNNTLRKIRNYITFLSATCSDIELRTPKYRESLSQATENTDIQIDDKILLRDEGIETYFSSFDIDPNGKNYATFFMSFSELNKERIERIVINSSDKLEKLLNVRLKDIRANFGLCDRTYEWEGGIFYDVGALAWTFNADEGNYKDSDDKIPNALVAGRGANLFGIEIMETTPDQAYKILKNGKYKEIKEVSRGPSPESEEVISCDLKNGITIYFEVGREQSNLSQPKVVDAIIKWSDQRN